MHTDESRTVRALCLEMLPSVFLGSGPGALRRPGMTILIVPWSIM
jgi:hypothetical protein